MSSELRIWTRSKAVGGLPAMSRGVGSFKPLATASCRSRKPLRVPADFDTFGPLGLLKSVIWYMRRYGGAPKKARGDFLEEFGTFCWRAF